MPQQTAKRHRILNRQPSFTGSSKSPDQGDNSEPECGINSRPNPETELIDKIRSRFDELKKIIEGMKSKLPEAE